MKNNKQSLGRPIEVDRPDKGGPTGERSRMDNNHERRMLEEAKSDDPYKKWKHPTEEQFRYSTSKKQKLYCTTLPQKQKYEDK